MVPEINVKRLDYFVDGVEFFTRYRKIKFEPYQKTHAKVDYK